MSGMARDLLREYRIRTIETTASADSREATTSASGTETKFDVAYWASPKTTPPISAGGQASRRPRRPSTMATSARGTTADKIGVWRPTMAPKVSVGKPETFASVMMGVAIAPNATGAVLATSDSAAAFSSPKPRASNITEVTATGVPNPANASSNAPKENAMTTAWMR